MMTCKECRELSIEVLYDELTASERESFDAHISTCEECSKAYKGMQETLKMMDRRIQTEPDEIYWKNFWKNVEEKIQASSEPAPQRRSSFKIFTLLPTISPRWAYGMAAILLVSVGIYLGRLLFVSRTQESLRASNPTTAATPCHCSCSALKMANSPRRKT